MIGTVYRWINKYKRINWKAVLSTSLPALKHKHTLHDCDSGMGEGVSVIVL